MTTKADAVEVEEKATETKTAISKEAKAPKKDAPKVTAAEKTEPAYPLYQLREHAREVFGVKPEIFDGVFSTAKEETLTKTEAKSRIEAFFKKEVK